MKPAPGFMWCGMKVKAARCTLTFVAALWFLEVEANAVRRIHDPVISACISC